MRCPKRSSLSPPPLPREHGAWVMLLLPLVLGSVMVGARLSAAWLLPPAVLLVFLSHYTILPAGRRSAWAAGYGLSSAVLFAAVVVLTAGPHRMWLLIIAGVAAVCGAGYTIASIAGAGRRIGTELVGMAAMSLSAPMMALAAEAPVTTRIMGAAAMAFAYSASTLSYVRAYTRLQQGRRSAAIGCVAAHITLLGGLMLLSRAGWLSPWWFMAFVPVVARTGWGLARPPRTVRVVGMRELWVALWFALIAVAII